MFVVHRFKKYLTDFDENAFSSNGSFMVKNCFYIEISGKFIL